MTEYAVAMQWKNSMSFVFAQKAIWNHGDLWVRMTLRNGRGKDVVGSRNFGIAVNEATNTCYHGIQYVT